MRKCLLLLVYLFAIPMVGVGVFELLTLQKSPSTPPSTPQGPTSGSWTTTGQTEIWKKTKKSDADRYLDPAWNVHPAQRMPVDFPLEDQDAFGTLTLQEGILRLREEILYLKAELADQQAPEMLYPPAWLPKEVEVLGAGTPKKPLAASSFIRKFHEMYSKTKSTSTHNE